MLTFNPKSLSADAIGQYTWQSMAVRERPSAQTYLEFAEADFADGQTDRHLVNSISNAKRALHLRLEDLCLGFGSVNLSKLGKFPLLLEYVRKCGIVAPAVLSQLNSLRNEVEHDFTIPKANEVTTFIGVTALFLSATDRWKDRQPIEVDYLQEVSDGSVIFNLVTLTFDWKHGIAKLHFRKKGESQGSATQTIAFASPKEEYFQCVRFVLANNY